jgi:hypothetical protein
MITNSLRNIINQIDCSKEPNEILNDKCELRKAILHKVIDVFEKEGLPLERVPPPKPDPVDHIHPGWAMMWRSK